ncbi:hypothetical protein D3C76_1694310 [compost metagenome]
MDDHLHLLLALGFIKLPQPRRHIPGHHADFRRLIRLELGDDVGQIGADNHQQRQNRRGDQKGLGTEFIADGKPHHCEKTVIHVRRLLLF